MQKHIYQTSKLSLFILILILTVCSCSYKNKNVLFKTDKKIKSTVPVLVVNAEKKDSGAIYRHRIKVGDRLLIKFLNNYDIGQAAEQSATAAANSPIINGTEIGYLVNYDSTSALPLIGRVNLVGLTRLEASKYLEKEYAKFIINPIIDLNIASLSVTILGEVSMPGKKIVDKENTTIIDVIALAGGLKDVAKKQNAKIIRGTEIIVVDLSKIGIVNDPNIIIHDNDIIYIEPYALKAKLEPVSSLAPIGTVTLAITQLILITIQIYNLTHK